MTRQCAAAGASAGLVAILLGGCAAAPVPGPAAPEFTVISSRAPAESTVVRATELEPSAPGSRQWQLTRGGGPFEVRSETDGTTTTRADPKGSRTTVLMPDGSVGLASQRDAADGAVTLFDPPLCLAPPLLRAGEEPAADSRVRTERAGTRRDDAGEARRTTRIAALERVRTPLGEFEAVRVDSVLTLKVPFASMRRETSTWVRPGDGPVAIRSDERILVMGIVPRNTAETRVRLPGGGGAP